jgi:hypothetical protein
MKELWIRFPVDQLKINKGKLKTKVQDFLIECIIAGDLQISQEDFLEIEVDPASAVLVDSFTHEGVRFHIYEIKIDGHDDVIDKINEWNEQFKHQLQ